MTRTTASQPAGLPNWDAMYRRGTPSWESGVPSEELERVLAEGVIRGRTALELGCGSGADAICLARHGFDVTAVDGAPTAIERARARAEMEDTLVNFVLDDVFEFAPIVDAFDLVYDAGLYDFIRQVDLQRYLDLLWRVTRPGSYYLSLVGASGERARGGPPQVHKDEIRDELGRLFDFVHIRRFRFESPVRKKGYLGWSCLMQRPTFD